MSGAAIGCWAIKCKTRANRYTWQGPMMPEPPCPKCNPHLAESPVYRQKNIPDQISLAVHRCLEQCDEILRRIEDLPEAGEDFGMSVAEKVEGIRDTISERNFVTANQKEALDNMEDGVSRWFHD